MDTEPIRVQRAIRFGKGFELDFESYKLRRGERVLKLERIPMEVLLLLVEQRGLLLTREQIAEKIWGKNAFLDTDNSINGAIRKIRQVLKDDPEQPRFIQTITGRGYRFIGPVDIDEERERPATDPPATPPGTCLIGAPEPKEQEKHPAANSLSAASAQAKARPALKWWALLAAGAAILIAAFGWFLWPRSSLLPQASGTRFMLAVLPFQNLTGDSTQEYFSDGVTEEMITQLGNLDPQHLGVIARTSVMPYKNSQIPLDRVGRELGVQYVLEGSVRRDSEHVRITAQLIQTRDQTHLWAREYDRQPGSLLAVQSEIAREIADEIQLTLGDRRSTKQAEDRRVLSPQAYESHDLYWKGQYFFNKRTQPDLRQAIAWFQQAIEKDPANARAYAGLADSYTLLGPYSGLPQAEFIPHARAAAVKALQLDESLPEAHAALALIVQNYDWDWQTSEKEFRRAIQLDPNYATAHQWYAEHLMWRGRFEEALAESERARQLDPLSLIIAADNGAILYFSRHYDQAIEKWRSVQEMDPNFQRARLIDAAYVEKQMYSDAIRDIETHRSMFGDAWYWAWLANVYGRSGQKIVAERAVNELARMGRRERVDPIIFAQAYAGMEQNDEALGWLERACAQHSTEIVSLKVSPIYDPLRGDPRFRGLLHRVGLDN